MCLCPIHIGNPTRRFVPGFSRPVLTVPCGHCKECIQQQQDDWFVRSVFEYKRVEAAGGAVWFPTLSYSDEYLPHYVDAKRHFRCPCFNKDHFKAFRNKLRVYLSRDLYLRNGELISRRRGSKPISGDNLIWNGRNDIKEENTIRFIYCCEYGGRRGRSHIHALLFVPFFVPSRVMYLVVKKAWIYGWSMWSKKGMKCGSLKAAQYCMKYISKDMNWMKRYNVAEYLRYLKFELRNSRPEDADSIREELNAFRRVMPHHGQSMGFGVTGLDYFRNSDGSWNKELCVNGHLQASKIGIPPTKIGQNFEYNMPMYYVRKIFYDVDQWNLYKLTEFGKDIFALRYELSLKRSCERLSVYFSSPNKLAEHLAPLDLSLSELETLSKELSTMLGSRKVSDLAFFDKVYRNIEGTPENECFIKDINLSMSEREQLDFLSDNALDFMLAQKSLDIEPSPKHCKIRANWVIQFGFNELPPFRDFDHILSIIESYESLLGCAQQKAYEYEREREGNLYGKDSNYTTDLIIDDYE